MKKQYNVNLLFKSYHVTWLYHAASRHVCRLCSGSMWMACCLSLFVLGSWDLHDALYFAIGCRTSSRDSQHHWPICAHPGNHCRPVCEKVRLSHQIAEQVSLFLQQGLRCRCIHRCWFDQRSNTLDT